LTNTLVVLRLKKQPMLMRILLSLSISVLFFGACKNDTPAPAASAAAPKPDTIRVTPVPTEGAVTYTITEGVVNWMGKKASGDTHYGTIGFKNGGQLKVNQGQLLSGAVTLDMSTIQVLDIKDPGEKKDLEAHLKDADFFEVKKYPYATFTIDEVLPSNTPDFNAVVVGQLNMKGKSNQVNIPVKLSIANNELTAVSATFPINRTKWGVNFRSGILGTLKDKLIEDTVPLSLTLKAKVQ
jgi:polyisoprenoid-binding protein YceI